MSECTTCGTNFVHPPEWNVKERECQWCIIKHQKEEIEALKNDVSEAQTPLAECAECQREGGKQRRRSYIGYLDDTLSLVRRLREDRTLTDKARLEVIEKMLSADLLQMSEELEAKE